jgi:hypothetical protein
MSRNNSVEGLPPYLYNPRNKRVMITTQEKFDRVDEYDKPYFIPCDSPEGPNKTVKISKASDDAKPVIGSTPEADAAKVEVKGTEDLIKIVMASDDKDELVQIGADLGVRLTKNMNVSTMQGHIEKKLAEMNIS